MSSWGYGDTCDLSIYNPEVREQLHVICHVLCDP